MGLLDGRVAIVTGAGGGIGRCHALALARAGCRVVVNDIGGARDGSGAGTAMADGVVAEIVAAGGQALANHDSVTEPDGCDAMVNAAIEAWGRLDIVVNNAGILRDRTFAKMSDDAWDMVLTVHLDGTRNMVAAALPALEEAGGGAIINTTSYSGMIGNFGQSNYAAAKAGIYGLSRVLSLELRKQRITVNCVAPVAKTRMTDDISMVSETWLAEQISPVVVFLASPAAKEVTGRVFGVQGGRIHVYEVHTNEGVTKEDGHWTPGEIGEQLDRITSFAPSRAAEGPVDMAVAQVFHALSQCIRPEGVLAWRSNMQWVVEGGSDHTVVVDADGAVVHNGLVGSASCTIHIDRDTLLKLFRGELEPARVFMSGQARSDNMGDLMKMGAAFDLKRVAVMVGGSGATVVADEANEEPTGVLPMGKTYDGGAFFVDQVDFRAYASATDDPNPKHADAASPMFHVRPFISLMQAMANDPELDIDMLRLVHGEHAMRFHRRLRHGDVVALRGDLTSVDVKSSGTVFAFGLYGFVGGELALEGRTSYFIRTRTKQPRRTTRPPAAAKPPPTMTLEQVVTDDQAMRYAAASGDDNPIHLDQATALSAGLPGCILHGLCTMAFAQRDVVNAFADADPSRLASLSVRFAGPVFPGETLTMQMWDHGDGSVSFATMNAEGKPVITDGRAKILEG
jgi:NAD(P)-dependent dehydrogenase (short-subunit alcohol dehydrogenase family)/acyl dehydratase